MEQRELKRATLIEKHEFKEGIGNNDKPYSRIDIVVEFNDQYKHKLFCTAMGDSAKIINNQKEEGDIIEFGYYVNSKKSETSGNWYTNAVVNFVKK